MKCKRCGQECSYPELIKHYEGHIWEINMVDGIKQEINKQTKVKQ